MRTGVPVPRLPPDPRAPNRCMPLMAHELVSSVLLTCWKFWGLAPSMEQCCGIPPMWSMLLSKALSHMTYGC